MAADMTSFSWANFLHSYGLKPWDAGEEQEGRAIMDAMETHTRWFSDMALNFDKIRTDTGASISSTLLNIQKYQVPQGQTQRWVRRLECLFMASGRSGSRDDAKNTTIGRIHLDPRLSPDYVAVSYTWIPSQGEQTTTGKYNIEKRDGGGIIPTKIRDNVIDRVVGFARYSRCKYFWIDKECINQGDPKQKQLAIQSMDLVYQLSRAPVALLSVCFKDSECLGMLSAILDGSFVIEGAKLKLRIRPGKQRKAAQALRLLARITADRWWTRAWTFQEDYRAATNMTLLFPHTKNLERPKSMSPNLFGTLPGEICVNSADFKREATRFCLAYKSERMINARDTETCNTVLQRAGKYTILLENYSSDSSDIVCMPMSPLVFANINARGIEDPFDTLAIAANVLDYPIRLDSKALSEDGYCLSMAVLALWILNGEIITYHDQSTGNAPKSDLNTTVLAFLQNQSLRAFSPPVAQKLSFAKNCRFVDVELTKFGLQTKGHIWRLGRKIDSRSSFGTLSETDSPCGLTGYERQWLKLLAKKLVSGILGSRFEPLAAKLNAYLTEDMDRLNPSVSKEFKDCMARPIIDAIRSGKTLRLASIVHAGREDSHSPYTGILVNDGVEDINHVFTSWGKSGSFTTTSKHVFLGVNEWGYAINEMPELITNRWVNGLFFFDKVKRQDVLFPWPTSFTS